MEVIKFLMAHFTIFIPLRWINLNLLIIGRKLCQKVKLHLDADPNMLY